ncbi:MAG TPA: hypothetical protein VEB41_16920 [Burkholderiales bacterium]|nr:hypothetical protein [Burkholderiales bacterium]
MTEHDVEQAVSRRYRELAREEPPAPLDDVIRARARAARGPRGWYFPAAAAALLVLAVAVTVQIEREQPAPYVAARQDPVSSPPPVAAAEAERKEEAFAQAEAPARAMRDRAAAKAESPDQWLERIARLRAEGRHEEADAALVAFRKRHPHFVIPPEMLRRVEKK